MQTQREAFRVALDTSAYSLVALARAAAPLMTEGGSIVTLTYYGAMRVVPNYNVMGVAKAALECCVRYLAFDLGKLNIRVNAVSAGPIKTLAARGIGNLSDMLKAQADRSPIPRNVDVNEVAATAVFPRQRWRHRHYGRDDLRGLRLQHYGVLTIGYLERKVSFRSNSPIRSIRNLRVALRH